VKRTRVAADNARGVAQESHQGAQRAVVRHRLCVAAAFADSESEIILARTVIHDTAEAERVPYELA
jgi:hypothetical protein